VIIYGVKIPRAQQPSEMELLRAVIWDLPRDLRDKILSLNGNFKGSANFRVELTYWDNDYSAKQIGEVVQRILLDRLGGHNGIIVGLRHLHNIEFPPCWEENFQIARVYELLHLIRKRWPKAFNPDQPVPLKIGIYADILPKLKCNAKELKIALGFHCRSEKYLKGLKAHVPRVDLNGKPVDEVTKQQAALAKRQLGGEG